MESGPIFFSFCAFGTKLIGKTMIQCSNFTEVFAHFEHVTAIFVEVAN